MWIVLTLAAALLIAQSVSWRIVEGGWQRAAADALIATVLWLASAWLLALLHLLTPPFLIARTIAFCVAAFLLRRRRAIDWRLLAALTPIVLWIAFSLLKGALLPVLSHDALSYHLPRAVFYLRAHGFDPLPLMEMHERTLPANYEMLLADAIGMSGSDTLTEWISTWFFLAFVVAGVALAERWWRIERSRALIIALLLACIPVVLLHTAAHKNDLMTAFFIVSALLWFGRWFTERRPAAMLLVILSLAAAIGTKPQALAVAGVLAVIAIVRDRRPKAIAAYAAASVIALALLGGTVYVSNARSQHAPLAMSAAGGEKTNNVVFGDWRNFWEVPYVLVAAPFSPRPTSLLVPWASHPWFWQRYEIFFSELGIPFALCAILLPFAIVFFRGREPDLRRERHVVTGAAFVFFASMLPVVFVPHGLYAISMPRYALFIAPIVFAWTVPPLLERASAVIVRVVILAAIGCFVSYAINFSSGDRFAPADFMVWAWHHPGTRDIPFDNLRAAEIVDGMAGPRDAVAEESAFGSWLYPAFGATLERPVQLLPEDGPVHIDDDVRFVAIDRAFNLGWRNPQFRDLSQYSTYLNHGAMTPSDLRVFSEVSRDPRFKLIWWAPKHGQAVFVRVR